MKEYKVGYIKPSIQPDKYSNKIEKVLNEMGGQGWEFKSNHEAYWTFEREK